MDFLEQNNTAASNPQTFLNTTQTPNTAVPDTIDVSQKGATNVAAQTYQNTNPDVTVEERLTNLLSKENPFLTAARSGAMRSANTRGLLNTTMAGTAGEKAAIESALPIAQQDAGYYQNKALAGQQGEIESFLSGQSANQQAGLYNVQGQIGSQLSAQDASQAEALQRLKGEQQVSLQELQGNQEMALKQADIEWNKLDLEARMQVEYDRMNNEAKAQFDQTANVIGSEYTQQLMQILSDPAFGDAASRNVAIAALNQQTQARYKIAAAAANANIVWSWGPAAVQTAGQTGGATTGGTTSNTTQATTTKPASQTPNTINQNVSNSLKYWQ